MIRTDIEIKDAIYDWIVEQALAGEISGKVYKDSRPMNSKLEDIEISILARGGNKQMQSAYVNVNIYVADVRRDGEMIEDTPRLRDLCDIARQDLDYVHFGDAIFELETQRVYKVLDTDMHAINNQVRVRFNNETDNN